MTDIVEGMNASIKGIVDSLRVAATYVPGTVEGSVMDKAAETIETLEAEVREQKNHSIRHLGICELSKENAKLKAELAAANDATVERDATIRQLREDVRRAANESKEFYNRMVREQTLVNQLVEAVSTMANRD